MCELVTVVSSCYRSSAHDYLPLMVDISLSCYEVFHYHSMPHSAGNIQ